MEQSSGYRACPVMLLERANMQPVVSDWREAVVYSEKTYYPLQKAVYLADFLGKDSRVIT